MSPSAEPITTIHAPTGGCGCGSTGSTCGCSSGFNPNLEIGLERPHYFPRQLVGPDDLNQGQRYVADRMRRHNRYLHGWGIACGLRVERCGPNEDGNTSCRVRVSAGYALDPYGDEIYLPADQVVDLCHQEPAGGLACGPGTDPWCSPVRTDPSPNGAWLAVRHIEVPVKPVRAPTGCSCEETHCEDSRIRDWYEFSLLDELPSHYGRRCGSTREYCRLIETCPPCPDSGWIVLAQVWISEGALTEIDAESNRRYVFTLAPLCPPCGDNDRERMGRSLGQGRISYIATTSERANASLNLNYRTREGDLIEVAVAVDRAEIEGQTAEAVKAVLAKGVLLDATTGAPLLTAEGQPVTAATIVARSPLTGASVVDSLDDLTIRVGAPRFDPVDDVSVMAKLPELIDKDGMAIFERESLGDLQRIGELDVETINGVSKVNADKLRAFGIRNLNDLATAKRLPSDLTGQANEKVEALRHLLGRNRKG